ncbi:MAG TPA: hypothetical protein GXZ20_02510 [Halanaerobiaceae bacterium]|mgnify:CR=1 FL=1|jgi:uncharacterized membrane protein|nr:hypothetical protein [Bacillota bacterium]HHU91996.1 hypothetical protein [Halanaerobiaceae bacterium]HOA40826.1 hypothetical protein [Halanaerobiales bacterium]HPZ62935.1 hypothetical protein [Halanaerobiales bacterium]HQD04160.1 hypothetical protein [Halanaerobiales bacterium]
MEDIISLLVAISIIFSGISKLMEKINKQGAEELIQEKKPVGETREAKPQTSVPVYETTSSRTVVEDLPVPDLNPYFAEDPGIERNQAKKTGSRVKQRSKRKEQKGLFSEGITEEDLIKGIIFQEILGEPRCRR